MGSNKPVDEFVQSKAEELAETLSTVCAMSVAFEVEANRMADNGLREAVPSLRSCAFDIRHVERVLSNTIFALHEAHETLRGVVYGTHE